MDDFRDTQYKFAGIQDSFGFFFGSRFNDKTTFHTAELFELGDYKGLGNVLVEFCNHLEQRLDAHKFHPDEVANGGAAARIRSASKTLREIAVSMKKSKGEEPDSEKYHWVIIGELVQIIASLFDHIEGKGHTNSIKRD